MLFNSYIFVLVFLPATLALYYLLGSVGRFRWCQYALVAASFYFYAYWSELYLALFLVSIVFNYALGVSIGRLAQHGDPRLGRVLLFGVAANLGALFYYKYTNFVIESVAVLAGRHVALEPIFLPLAISFYTFTQIAYLVDASRGETREYDFFHYALFVAFFPHLIAGPIVHHSQLMPQFAERRTYRLDHRNLALGITLFVIGLFKKVVFADAIEDYATPVFDAAARGATLGMVEAWQGTLAYTLQLYFDFSGYSDMAVGLGLMFNIRLPLNFNSPYKAVNIIDFWRRWHMTLSQFLRDYIYLPLGGNRRGSLRRYVNLVLTMLIGGLWHGAGWNFVIWGALHGTYLAINHAWHGLRRRLGWPPGEPSWWGALLGGAVTLGAVMVGWVFFRADSLDAALSILTSMTGVAGLWSPDVVLTRPAFRAEQAKEIVLPFLLLAIAVLAPNSQQWVGEAELAAPSMRTPPREPAPALRWRPSLAWAAIIAAVFVYTLTQLSSVTEFLYYQF